MTGSAPAALTFLEGLSVVRPDVSDRDELLGLLADSAYAAGYATSSFREALLGRERRFPTGLPTPLPCALPHADAEHVRQPGIAAALLSTPIAFQQMGDPSREVSAELVLMLLVDAPTEQVTVLGRLLSVLQQADLADQLSAVDTPAQLASTLTALCSVPSRPAGE